MQKKKIHVAPNFKEQAESHQRVMLIPKMSMTEKMQKINSCKKTYKIKEGKKIT